MKMTTQRVASAVALAVLSVATTPAMAQEARPSPFLALKLTPEFMSERMRDEQGPVMLWDKLVPMNSYSYQPIPNRTPEAWSDADVKDLLTALDAILTRWMEPVGRSRTEQVAFIQQQFSRDHFSTVSGPGDRLANDPRYLQWARDHRDFIQEAGGAVVFLQLLQHLRPGLIESPHLPGGYDPEFAAHNKLPFGDEMAFISAVIDLPDASALLPRRFDLKRLRARERELRRQDEEHAYEYPGQYGPDYELALVSQHVREAWTRGLLHESSVHMIEEINLLSARMAQLADPVKSGFCERMKVDLASLAASGGDPARVRMASGGAPDIHTWDYDSIAGAYRRGCAGKRDVAAAKRTLQLWAEGHHDHGKLAMSSYCLLARWERYGIGGRRDPNAAKAWEERAIRDVGVPCQADRPEDLIDPRDPMTDLHR